MKVPKILKLTGQSPEDYLLELRSQVDFANSRAEERVPCEWEFIARFSGVEFEKKARSNPCDQELRENLRSSLQDTAATLLPSAASLKFEVLATHADRLSRSWRGFLSEISRRSWIDVVAVLDEMVALSDACPVWFWFLALLADNMKNDLINCIDSSVWLPHPSDLPRHLWLDQLGALSSAFDRSEHQETLRPLMWPWAVCSHVIFVQDAVLSSQEELLLCRFLFLDARADIRPLSVLASFVTELRRKIVGASPAAVADAVDVLPEWLLCAPWPGLLLRAWHRLVLTRAALGPAGSWTSVLEALLPEDNEREAAEEWTEASLAWAGASL